MVVILCFYVVFYMVFDRGLSVYGARRRISEAMGFDLDLDVLPSATDVWAIEEKVWQHWGSSH